MTSRKVMLQQEEARQKLVGSNPLVGRRIFSVKMSAKYFIHILQGTFEPSSHKDLYIDLI